MGNDDVGVLAITEQKASGLGWQVLGGFGGDQRMRLISEVNSQESEPLPRCGSTPTAESTSPNAL
jgi:hypothetical protein